MYHWWCWCSHSKDHRHAAGLLTRRGTNQDHYKARWYINLRDRTCYNRRRRRRVVERNRDVCEIVQSQHITDLWERLMCRKPSGKGKFRNRLIPVPESEPPRTGLYTKVHEGKIGRTPRSLSRLKHDVSQTSYACKLCVIIVVSSSSGYACFESSRPLKLNMPNPISNRKANRLSVTAWFCVWWTIGHIGL